MILRWRRYSDFIIVFALIVGGACIGSLAFSASNWIGRVVVILIGAMIFFSGIAYAFIRGLARRVDNSEKRQ